MRRALLLTAFDRPEYLAEVLRTWSAVDGLDGWHVRVAVEPGEHQERVLSLIREALPAADLHVNAERLGVAVNPHRHLDALFAEGFDFVARTEDDLVVADDVLRLLEHCSSRYAADPEVAVACAYSAAADGADPGALHRTTAFSPWLWGTWRDRWQSLIGPTWDLDYSTWNGSPGFESGWDWHLNTRVLPAHGLTTIAPLASRVQNIGVVGQHGTAENHEQAASFRPVFGRPSYREA